MVARVVPIAGEEITHVSRDPEASPSVLYEYRTILDEIGACGLTGYSVCRIVMLQAHSILWHYLWLAPLVLELGLALRLWWRGTWRWFPFFFCYLIFGGMEGIILYGLDIAPSVTWQAWWGAFWAGTIIEALLKFGVIAELVHDLLRPWPALANVGRNFVSIAGVVLVLVAALAAALTAPDNAHWLISGSHTLRQTVYITDVGLILSVFLLAAYFHLPWERARFGIALGFGVAWCEHLASWALLATGGLSVSRELLDFLNMATYHVVVLIWFYYLLIPEKVMGKSAVSTPENNLAVWNRELERLLQQ